MNCTLFLVDDDRSHPFWKRGGFPDKDKLLWLWRERVGSNGNVELLVPPPAFGGSLNSHFCDEIISASNSCDAFGIITDEVFGSDSSGSGGTVLLNTLAQEDKFMRGCVYSSSPGDTPLQWPETTLKFYSRAGGRSAEAIELLDYVAFSTRPVSQDSMETNEACLLIRSAIHDLEGLASPIRSDIEQLMKFRELIGEITFDYCDEGGYLRAPSAKGVSKNLYSGVIAIFDRLEAAHLITSDQCRAARNSHALQMTQMPTESEVLDKMKAAKLSLEELIRELRRILANSTS